MRRKAIGDKKVFSDFNSYEIRNMLGVAEIIINSAIERRTSVGAHFRFDTYANDEKKAENKTETVEKDKPSAVDDKNADEAVKDLEDNFNDEKKYLTKDVASEAEKEVDSGEKKNSSDETGKEN